MYFMNKTELVAVVAEKAGLTKKDAERVVNATVDTIVESLVKGEKGGQKLVKKTGRGGLFLALLLFVGIPLPGTGAWTGTLAASFLNMGLKSTSLAVSLGVILAGIIMGIGSHTALHVFGL